MKRPREIDLRNMTPEDVAYLAKILCEEEERQQALDVEREVAARASATSEQLLQHESLARIGYVAYGEDADWKNYEGKPMPTWEDLPEHIRRKWRAATFRVVQQVLTGGWLPESNRLLIVHSCAVCGRNVVDLPALGYEDAVGVAEDTVLRSVGGGTERIAKYGPHVWYHRGCYTELEG